MPSEYQEGRVLANRHTGVPRVSSGWNNNICLYYHSYSYYCINSSTNFFTHFSIRPYLCILICKYKSELISIFTVIIVFKIPFQFIFVYYYIYFPLSFFFFLLFLRYLVLISIFISIGKKTLKSPPETNLFYSPKGSRVFVY